MVISHTAMSTVGSVLFVLFSPTCELFVIYYILWYAIIVYYGISYCHFRFVACRWHCQLGRNHWSAQWVPANAVTTNSRRYLFYKLLVQPVRTDNSQGVNPGWPAPLRNPNQKQCWILWECHNEATSLMLSRSAFLLVSLDFRGFGQNP